MTHLPVASDNIASVLDASPSQRRAALSQHRTSAELRHLLSTLLRSDTTLADEQWRRWSDHLVGGDRLTPSVLAGWWRAVTDFDGQLAEAAARPVAVPPGTVLVAGSGKESFKTFNVSTAAAILAAASGTPVVKGVSRSVSAVSGAADVLDVLGVGVASQAHMVPWALDRWGIAFAPYPVFCPRYAARYDGVFDRINPASFFMPVAALPVRASAFVFGLADPRVELAAQALSTIRPGLRGVVVATDLSHREFVDEYCEVGSVLLASTPGFTVAGSGHGAAVTDEWRHAVAQRPTHELNGAMVAASLRADSDTACTHLADCNAALIVAVGADSGGLPDALDKVRRTRRAGLATRLLGDLAAATQ